jgi:glycosyltransferase involved in cell wall biosynthesis
VHHPYDQRIFHRECVSLAESGYNVTLIAYGDISGRHENVNLVSLGCGDNAGVGLNITRRWLRTRKAFTAARKINADIYHFHDPELIGTGIALKKKTGARVVYDCHEDNVAYMSQKTYIALPLRKIMATFIRFQEKRAIRQLDAIVTADEGMRKQFKENGAERVVKVENYPKLELFSANGENAEKKYDIVYHGTIPRYHLEMCFSIDNELVDMGLSPRWLFIGKCPDITWARSMVRTKNAIDRFTFHGMIPHEKIAPWVRTGRIGIIPLPDYPKFQKNLPTKLFEFMALKLPVVLSDLAPSRPYVGDGRCAIMVDPNSSLGYAKAIARLLESPELRHKMGHEGKTRVLSNYNWNVAFSAMAGLYKELLS